MKIYYSILYRFYKFSEKLGHDQPIYTGVLIFSLLQIFNYISILGILIGLTKSIIIVDSPTKLFLSAVLIIGINCYLVYRKSKFDKMKSIFDLEKKVEKNNSIAITLVYTFFSISLFILCAIYARNNPIIHK